MTSPSKTDEKSLLVTPVIFDTDPGIDDAMALLYLNACKRLSLKGICTVFGNASLDQCNKNALYLCERFDIDVPVYAGANQTILGANENDYPTFVHGEDGLGNLHAPASNKTLANTSAVDYLLEAAEQYAGELVIIAVGRMTNVALAVKASPAFSKQVKEIIIMGGAVAVKGNVTEWAEANIFGDPEAANILFASSIPITQLGLDVTEKTIMSQSYIDSLSSRCGDAGKLLTDITPYYLDFYKSNTGINGFACHDSSAIAYAEEPSIYTTMQGTLSVVVDGEQRGRTLFIEGSGNHTLCTAVDAEKMLNQYDEHMVSKYS